MNLKSNTDNVTEALLRYSNFRDAACVLILFPADAQSHRAFIGNDTACHQWHEVDLVAEEAKFTQ